MLDCRLSQWFDTRWGSASLGRVIMSALAKQRRSHLGMVWDRLTPVLNDRVIGLWRAGHSIRGTNPVFFPWRGPVPHRDLASFKATHYRRALGKKFIP